MTLGQARTDSSGALDHIILCGIEKKLKFKVQQDYTNFLKRLSKLLTETATSWFTWALMINHFHLLIRTALHLITAVIRRLLTGMALRSI